MRLTKIVASLVSFGVAAAAVTFSSAAFAQGRDTTSSDLNARAEGRVEADVDTDDGDGSAGGGGILDGDLDGLRAHVGLILGGGPSHPDDPADIVRGSLLFSLKGGVFVDRLELGLEFSPATFVINFDPDLPSVQLNAYGGYHIPVYKSISWPLRLGIGFTTPTFRGEAGDTLLEIRADLIGVSALLADQFMLDVYLPSFRTNIDPGIPAALFTYVFGVGAAWSPEL